MWWTCSDHRQPTGSLPSTLPTSVPAWPPRPPDQSRIVLRLFLGEERKSWVKLKSANKQRLRLFSFLFAFLNEFITFTLASPRLPSRGVCHRILLSSHLCPGAKQLKEFSDQLMESRETREQWRSNMFYCILQRREEFCKYEQSSANSY